MDADALGNLLSGLAGAVLGALVGGKAALVVAERQIKADRGLQRRDELRSVIAQFWGACDALWDAQQDLGWTIHELQLQHQSKDYTGKEQLNERRMQKLGLIGAARGECRQALALLRLLFPGLVAAAEDLISTSASFSVKLEGGDMGKEHVAARDAALREFERQARGELSVSGGDPSGSIHPA